MFYIKECVYERELSLGPRISQVSISTNEAYLSVLRVLQSCQHLKKFFKVNFQKRLEFGSCVLMLVIFSFSGHINKLIFSSYCHINYLNANLQDLKVGEQRQGGNQRSDDLTKAPMELFFLHPVMFSLISYVYVPLIAD